MLPSGVPVLVGESVRWGFAPNGSQSVSFSMSDVSVESSRLRRIVLFHALLSFFFYSLILSVVANLVVTS